MHYCLVIKFAECHRPVTFINEPRSGELEVINLIGR